MRCGLHDQLQQWLWLLVPTTETQAGDFIPELEANQLLTTNRHYYQPKHWVVKECANTIFVAVYHSLHIWGWNANPLSILAVVSALLTPPHTASAREGPSDLPFPPSLQTHAVPGTRPADHQMLSALIQLTNPVKVCWVVGLGFSLGKLVTFLGSIASAALWLKQLLENVLKRPMPKFRPCLSKWIKLLL